MSASSTGKTSFRAHAIRPEDRGPELVSGPLVIEHSTLTQLGKGANFREEPRWETELDVSTVCGEHDVEATTRAVLGRVRQGWSVRHFPISRLSDANYRSLHSPTKRNPQHASIVAPLDTEDVEYHKIWWQSPRRVKLRDISNQGTAR